MRLSHVVIMIGVIAALTGVPPAASRAPDGRQKMIAALAIDTAIPAFDDHRKIAVGQLGPRRDGQPLTDRSAGRCHEVIQRARPGNHRAEHEPGGHRFVHQDRVLRRQVRDRLCQRQRRQRPAWQRGQRERDPVRRRCRATAA